jgi:HK97 family phage major capsid protein
MALMTTSNASIAEQSRLLQLCNVIPGGESGEIRIPVYDNSDHSVSLYGGISRQWLGENSTATPSDAKLRLVSLILKRLAIYSNITNILLQETPAMKM